LRTRVGTLNLLVPQDSEGTFSTRLFSRYQRNEKALVLALMEMCTSRGVSTRKVKEITNELCATSFSKSLVSSLASSLDAELQAWRKRQLEAETNPAALYALRLFGVRTILIGAQLLLRNEDLRAHSLRVAPVIHALDAASALVAGDRPPSASD
jgi:hypothetical protein